MDFSMKNNETSVKSEYDRLQSIRPISPVNNCQNNGISETNGMEKFDHSQIKQEENEIENHSSTNKTNDNLPENEPYKVEGAIPGEVVSSHFLEPECDISDNGKNNQEQLSQPNESLEISINGSKKYRKVTYIENNGRVFPAIELSPHCGEPTQRGQIHPAAWKHPPSADRLIPFLSKQNEYSNQFNFSNPSDFYLQKIQDIVIPNNAANVPSSESELGSQENKSEDETKHPLYNQTLDRDYLEKQKFSAENGKGMYQCPECPYTTPYRANLKVHLMVHTGNKPYGCSTCGFKTTTSSNLKKHMREHTGERPYKCHECESSFKTTGALKTHMMNHTGEKPFACPDCDYKSTKSVNLKRHIMTHTGEKKYACTECEYMCTGKKDLGRHMMVHTGEKPYSCPECDYACIQKETLKKHILTHTGERPFKCSQCTAGFRACGDLKRHMLVHTGEKPFACSACPYRCNKEVNLKRHMLTHTGEKPFTCPYCDYRCTENRLLKKHVSSHMYPDGTYPENRSTENVNVLANLSSSFFDNNELSPVEYMNSLGILPIDS
ncbi:unnamed protein product [Meganyctiphanes norvegica]|uniref:C2H2-type domain-containing protein n=1 Tax=Meganyctiphanes norvegica TaxID=48144 RepID=A0AAV2SH95_MEGNR